MGFSVSPVGSRCSFLFSFPGLSIPRPRLSVGCALDENPTLIPSSGPTLSLLIILAPKIHHSRLFLLLGSKSIPHSKGRLWNFLSHEICSMCTFPLVSPPPMKFLFSFSPLDLPFLFHFYFSPEGPVSRAVKFFFRISPTSFMMILLVRGLSKKQPFSLFPKRSDHSPAAVDSYVITSGFPGHSKSSTEFFLFSLQKFWRVFLFLYAFVLGKVPSRRSYRPSWVEMRSADAYFLHDPQIKPFPLMPLISYRDLYFCQFYESLGVSVFLAVSLFSNCRFEPLCCTPFYLVGSLSGLSRNLSGTHFHIFP